MRHRTFGKSGFECSEIGFGAWAIGGGWGNQRDDDSVGALHAALDRGVNFIDTAAGYGNGRSERIIGTVLRERKEEVFVATKTPPAPGAWPPSPYDRAEERYPEAYLRDNIEERLRNLNTDCLDLLQLHTWTRSWNRDPQPFAILRKLKEEGKVRMVGVSTPEQDQNAVIDLMRGGWVDAVQVIFNLFEQEPAAELLPVARETNTAIIVRVAFDEGALTGKFTAGTTFPEGDFRRNYFAGDRVARAAARAEEARRDAIAFGYDMPTLALKFALSHQAVSTVIPGMRNVRQVEANTAASDAPDLTEDQLKTLQRHNWLRGVWYSGK